MIDPWFPIQHKQLKLNAVYDASRKKDDVSTMKRKGWEKKKRESKKKRFKKYQLNQTGKGADGSEKVSEWLVCMMGGDDVDEVIEG